MCIEEQARDLIPLLVANVLTDRLADRVFQVRPLALDHDEGNSVHEEHDVGAPRLLTSASLDDELLGDVIDVILRVCPVDVIELEALGVPFDRLLHALSEAQQVVDLLVGQHQTVVYDILQGLHSREDVSLTERILAALETDDVLPSKPLGQHLLKHDVCQTPAPGSDGLFWCEIVVSELLQKLQGG